MGRGLAAILAVSDRAGDEPDELRSLPLDLIEPSPHQPRGRFDEEALQALAESLRARGVIQPILVRPATGGRYELIAGERRWRAARLADLEEIPALVRAHDDGPSPAAALRPDAEIFPISARTGTGVEPLVEHLLSLLPEGPQCYWRGRITRIGYEFAP